MFCISYRRRFFYRVYWPGGQPGESVVRLPRDSSWEELHRHMFEAVKCCKPFTEPRDLGFYFKGRHVEDVAFKDIETTEDDRIEVKWIALTEPTNLNPN